MRWTDETPVKELVEQLRPLAGTGAVLVMDNDCFTINVGAYYDLPEEDPEAKEGAPNHWAALEDAVEEMAVPQIEGAKRPHNLLAALAVLAGFEAEGE